MRWIFSIAVFGGLVSISAAQVQVGNGGSVQVGGTVTGSVCGSNPCPVVNGGTGSTTASGALSNLGGLPINNPTFTGTLSGTSASFSGTVAAGTSNVSGNQTVGGNQTVTGALSGATTNSEQIAGNGANTTIQASLNNGGSVNVPYTFGPGEMEYVGSRLTQSPATTATYTKYGVQPVRDLRPLDQDASYLQAQSVAALDGMNEGGDISRAAVCVMNGACHIALVGDSIDEGAAIAPNSVYFDALVSYLQRRYPNVTWSAEDFAIGGANVENFNNSSFLCGSSFSRANAGSWYTGQEWINGPPYFQWINGCTNGQSWEQNVAAFDPDIVILSSMTANEYSYGTSQFAADLSTAINSVHGMASSPQATIILTTQATPNYAWGSSLLGSPDPAIFESFNEVVRDMANRYGILLADPDRYFNAYTYGIDPARRHYQPEHAFGTMSGVAYNSANWAPATGFSGTLPTLTNSGALNATLTWASGNAQVVQRNRSAIDFTTSNTFQNLTSASIPSVWWRMDSNGAGYKVQLVNSTSTTWTMNLYWSASNGGTQTSLGSGTCTSSVAWSVAVTVDVRGDHIRVWCNTPGNGDFVNVINTLDYNRLNAGYFAVGIQNGYGTVSNQYVYYGNPLQYYTAQTSVGSGLGTQLPPGFGGSYQGNGDNDTNYLSIGGDGVHHPSHFGMDAYYLASFAPVLNRLDSAMTINSALSVAHAGYSGNYGGLIDGTDGTVRSVDGPTGGMIINNVRNTILEQWDDSISDAHQFMRPVQVGSAGTPIHALQWVTKTGSPIVACSANAYCQTTITFASAFSSTSYHVQCSVEGGAPLVYSGANYPESSTTTTTLNFYNPTAASINLTQTTCQAWQ